jgi:hypothetical protein
MIAKSIDLGYAKQAETKFQRRSTLLVLNSIERSTMGKESEEDFDHLFEDLDDTWGGDSAAIAALSPAS